MKRIFLGIAIVISIAVMQGCASYTTPAAGVNISSLTDDDIAEIMKVEPAK